jgi:hypothetical protein
MIDIPGPLHLEKGMCHVSQYIHFFESNTEPSPAFHWADDHPGDRRYYWFCLDTNRPRHFTSGFEADRGPLDAVHLPVPCFSRSAPFLMPTKSLPPALERLGQDIPNASGYL